MTPARIATGLALVAALVVGAFWLMDKRPGLLIDEPGVRVFNDPIPLPELELRDHNDRRFTKDRLEGRWTLAFFGYTHCPDICPTTLTALDGVARRLEKRNAPQAADTQYLFVSVDPHRDTPERLGEHVTYFNPQLIGATGEPGAVQDLARQLGIHYEYEDAETGDPIRDVVSSPASDDYLVHHFAGLMLVDPDARLIATILPPHSVSRIIDVYTRIRQYYED